MSPRGWFVLAGLALAGSLLWLYGMGISPEPSGYADSDELVAVSSLGSVAHPPGYAMQVELMYQLKELFGWQDPVYGFHWLAAIWQALALGVMWYLVAERKDVRGWGLWVGLILAYGLQVQYWLYGTFVEVQQLANLLMALLWWSSFRWWQQRENSDDRIWWLWLATTSGFAGLALGHWQPFILQLPVLGVMLISGIGRKWWSGWRALSLSVVVASGISVGFLVMQVPLIVQIERESPVSWTVREGWWEHVTRRDYGVQVDGVEGSAYVLPNMDWGWFTALLEGVRQEMRQVGWLWVASVAAISWMWKYRLAERWFASIGFLTGLWWLAYLYEADRFIQRDFFEGILLRQLFGVRLVLLVIVSIGLRWCWAQGLYRRALYGLVWGLVGWQLWQNVGLLDPSGREVVSKVMQRTIAEAGDDSLVICTEDVSCYGLYAQQWAKGRGSTIQVLGDVPNYEIGLTRLRPDLYPYDRYELPEYLPLLVGWNLPGRRVFVTNATGQDPLYGGMERGPFFLEPQGYLQEVKLNAEDVRPVYPLDFLEEAREVQVHALDLFGQGLVEFFAIQAAYGGYVSLLAGDVATAEAYLRLAQELDASHQQSAQLLANLEQYAEGMKLDEEERMGAQARFEHYMERSDEWEALDAYEEVRKLSYAMPRDQIVLKELGRLAEYLTVTEQWWAEHRLAVVMRYDEADEYDRAD